MSRTWRRRNALALYDSHYGPNMTPMVDVVMVILIFFMASTAFLGPEWFLKTHLPTVGSKAPTDAPEQTRLRVVLSVGPQNKTLASVSGADGLTMEQLETKITDEAKRGRPDQVVVLVNPGRGRAL